MNTTPPPQAPDATALVIERLRNMLPFDDNDAAARDAAITHLAAHDALQARCARLEDSLADMVDIAEKLRKTIAEYTQDPRVLTTKSPRLEIARELLAARTAKEAAS